MLYDEKRKKVKENKGKSMVDALAGGVANLKTVWET